MTISDAMPQLWASSLRTTAAGNAAATTQVLDAEKSLDFRIGPECAPARAMQRATRFAAMVLPALLAEAPDPEAAADTVLQVHGELVDVTARHRASLDVAGRISFDGDHVLITVEEMDQPLPAPEAEPGLYLVHRLTDDRGQYCGEAGGFTTWASVPVLRKAPQL
ncbi:hypothetical protein [Streptomyces sp. NPDC051684]|uniref:hypothetical protein n=1 Tax=Streptomyces sp. NPDC051684 TaxID=3365670 RepID=UPI0037BA38C1